MLVRYLPGKFDDKIPLPVQKKVTAYAREGEDGGTLVLETGPGRREKIDLALSLPLMPGEGKIRAWLKMGGLFILIVGFCAGAYNMVLKMCCGGFSEINVLHVIQFAVSLTLVGYASRVFKVTLERYLYGGISFDRGDICFQSEDEKALFVDVLKNKRRK